MRDAIQEWMTDTRKKAEELGDRFGKSAEYFLTIFYGNEVSAKVREVNLYNAWSWQLAQTHSLRKSFCFFRITF